MASVNALLGEALAACGRKGGPTPDLTSSFAKELRTQLLRTLRVRIPQFVPGMYRDGIIEMTLADPLAPTPSDATGIYPFPANVAFPFKPLILVDKNSAETTPAWETNQAQFWSAYVLSDVSLGTPSGVLIAGKTFRFRPILNPALGPWRMTSHAALYPDPPANDTDDLIPIDLEDAVKSGAILWHAWAQGWDELAQRYQPQWEAALVQLLGMDVAKSRSVYYGSEF